ncbi:MAG: family 43 glycosylhydrolase [Nibricoccus sp.]
MKKIQCGYRIAVLFALEVLLAESAFATNPLVMDQFTADPSARVFEGRIFVYPSHDVAARESKGRPGWFCMEDYHVFSSEDLTGWKDHGVIVRQTEVPWVDASTYSLWAPDCVFYNGKYNFIFPAIAKTGGFRIGVATADKPEGPFIPRPVPIEGVRGIDPCVLVDKDGSAYLYYSARKIFVGKLNRDFTALEGPALEIANLPTRGLLEGPFVFERNGTYYLTYPHVENKIERLEYATSKNPLGPFTPAGVILDEAASGCWTVHQSIVEYQGQWYLFYHDKDLSPDCDKNRSVRADRLYFNDDGTIRKVVPTLRGVGVVKATEQIQIDRYSETSKAGVALSFVDSADPKKGWKVSITGPGAWVRFNEVDFGKGAFLLVRMSASSATGGEIEIRQDGVAGSKIGQIKIPRSSKLEIHEAKLAGIPAGVHDIVVIAKERTIADIDWIQFQE